MKDESVSALLESGEVQMTEDVIFMVDLILTLFERAADSDNDGFLSIALGMLGVWRESLETGEAMDASEASMNIIMGRTILGTKP